MLTSYENKAQKPEHVIMLLHRCCSDSYREFTQYVSQQRAERQDVTITTEIYNIFQQRERGFDKKYGYSQVDMLTKSIIVDGDRITEVIKGKKHDH